MYKKVAVFLMLALIAYGLPAFACSTCGCRAGDKEGQTAGSKKDCPKDCQKACCQKKVCPKDLSEGMLSEEGLPQGLSEGMLSEEGLSKGLPEGMLSKTNQNQGSLLPSLRKNQKARLHTGKMLRHSPRFYTGRPKGKRSQTVRLSRQKDCCPRMGQLGLPVCKTAL